MKALNLFIINIMIFSFCFGQGQKLDSYDQIKNQIQYSKWISKIKSKPEKNYRQFKLDSAMVYPWKIKRVQEIGEANNGLMTQYVLVKSLKKIDEIIRVSITECKNRLNAVKGLIEFLNGVQRPNYQLIEDKDKIIGDITVGFGDDPESAIYFIQGNMLITVENASKEPIVNLSKLAIKINETLFIGTWPTPETPK